MLLDSAGYRVIKEIALGNLAEDDMGPYCLHCGSWLQVRDETLPCELHYVYHEQDCIIILAQQVMKSLKQPVLRYKNNDTGLYSVKYEADKADILVSEWKCQIKDPNAVYYQELGSRSKDLIDKKDANHQYCWHAEPNKGGRKFHVFEDEQRAQEYVQPGWRRVVF